MAEEYWRNSQLSVARFYGMCRLNGHEYIEVKESEDLVRKDFLPFYRKLKRKRFLTILRDNPHATDKELKAIYKDACKTNRNETKEQEIF